MEKFSDFIVEGKKFLPNPELLKKYASFIIPLYLDRTLPCDKRLIDEYLEMSKTTQFDKNKSVISDLEILALKNLYSNPLSQTGYVQIKADIANKCKKLEVFLRKYFTAIKFD